MAFRSVRHLPPRGSTAWGARQFLRLLDEEDHIAAERERLLAAGWRSPSYPGLQSARAATGEQTYVDLIDRDRAHRAALDEEARRRVILGDMRASADTSYGNAAAGNSPIHQLRRIGRSELPAPDAGVPGYVQLASAGKLADLIRAIGGAAAAGEALGTCVAGSCPTGEGWSIEHLWPPYGSLPQNADPDEDLTEPLPGYPDQSDELRDFGRPLEPLPLPEDLTRPPAPPPLSLERPEPMVRLSLSDIERRFFDAGILIRAESPSTRQDNEDIIDMAKDAMESCGWKARHAHGASEKERYIPNDDYPGSTKGGHYTDGTVEGTGPDGREALFDFNTAKSLADGRWVAYERRAEDAIRLLKQKVDKLRTSRFEVYPKSRGMDREIWRESVRPFVQEAVRALLGC
jgi:hypothetical protein